MESSLSASNHSIDGVQKVSKGLGQPLDAFSSNDPMVEIPDDATLEKLRKAFEKNVSNKIRNIEDQIKDAQNRLQMRLVDCELVISLAENRVALGLDPRHLEQVERLKQIIHEFDEMVGKNGIASTTL